MFAVSFHVIRSIAQPDGNSWNTNPDGMERLIAANRIEPYEDGKTIRYALKLR